MDEPSVYLDEFADTANLSKADGSLPINTQGLYEEASEEFQGSDESAAMQDYEAQLTTFESETSAYGEGDLVTVKGKNWEILDVKGDGYFRIFLMTPTDGAPFSISH